MFRRGDINYSNSTIFLNNIGARISSTFLLNEYFNFNSELLSPNKIEISQTPPPPLSLDPQTNLKNNKKKCHILLTHINTYCYLFKLFFSPVPSDCNLHNSITEKRTKSIWTHGHYISTKYGYSANKKIK